MNRRGALATLFLGLLAATSSNARSQKRDTAKIGEWTSAGVLLRNKRTGKVLVSKNLNRVVPIASLTKMVTAIVVVESGASMDEKILLSDADRDKLKGTKRGLDVGTVWTRGDLLKACVVASDNHAAHAIARAHPGGMAQFLVDAAGVLRRCGLKKTRIVEPTGLDPRNCSTPKELAAILELYASHQVLSRYSSQERVSLNGLDIEAVAQNTNKLVGAQDWNILASKTGYTSEAGACVAFEFFQNGEVWQVVLTGSRVRHGRWSDAQRLRNLVGSPA